MTENPSVKSRDFTEGFSVNFDPFFGQFWALFERVFGPFP